jgi:hypothetical protein
MIRFKIIDTFNITNVGGIVMAECLDEEYDFSLSDSAMFGEVPIKPIINMPRKIDEKGNVMLNVFAFQLRENSDKDKFRKGEVVLLKP